MDAMTLKSVHVACVVLSGTLFFVRGLWMIRESALLRTRWALIAPHVVDTVLLASAIGTAALTRQYPLQAPWLTAKVAALLLYIGLGMVALRPGRTRGARIAAWLAALAVFCYIVAVAITRHPMPWSSLLP